MKQRHSFFSNFLSSVFKRNVKPGFTLSENLITVGVIAGIVTVGALTLGSLSQNQNGEAKLQTTQAHLQHLASHANLKGDMGRTPDHVFRELAVSLTDKGDYVEMALRNGSLIKVSKTWRNGLTVVMAYADNEKPSCITVSQSGNTATGTCNSSEDPNEQDPTTSSAALNEEQTTREQLANNPGNTGEENLILNDGSDNPDLGGRDSNGTTTQLSDPQQHNTSTVYVGPSTTEITYNLKDQCNNDISNATVTLKDENNETVEDEDGHSTFTGATGTIAAVIGRTYKLEVSSADYRFNAADPKATFLATADPQQITLVGMAPQTYRLTINTFANLNVGPITVTSPEITGFSHVLNHPYQKEVKIEPTNLNTVSFLANPSQYNLSPQLVEVPQPSCSLESMPVTFSYTSASLLSQVAQKTISMATWVPNRALTGIDSGWDTTNWRTFMVQHGTWAYNYWISEFNRVLGQTAGYTAQSIDRMFDTIVRGRNQYQLFTANGQEALVLNPDTMLNDPNLVFYNRTTGQPMQPTVVNYGTVSYIQSPTQFVVQDRRTGNVYTIEQELHSPIKVSLNGVDAKLNSTDSYLVDLDGQHRHGPLRVFSKGGLNDNEAWLVMDRAQNGFWDKHLAVDGDDIFGDHLGQYRSGYEDLQKTFQTHLQVDEQGRRYIQLHPLSWWEKTWTPVSRALGLSNSDPSFDLKLMTRDKQLVQASDVLTKLYVDYQQVDEWDHHRLNWIGQRAAVTYRNGKAATSADQWFATTVALELLSPQEARRYIEQGEAQTANAKTTADTRKS